MSKPVRNFIFPVALALLAISLVNVGTLYKLPFGYFIGTLTGKGVSPFMRDEVLDVCFEPEACPWLKEGDVLVAVCPKCGNNWIMTIVHELRTVREKNLQDFDDILQVVPWVNLNYYPGIDKTNFHEAWGNTWNNSAFPFRAFKSNGTPMSGNKKIMPVRERPELKYLVMTRNPVDQMFSAVKFTEVALPPEFRKLWGGMPALPRFTIDNLLTLASFVDGHLGYKFLAGWWEYRNEPNVLLLHYSTVFKDTPKYIKKIADFIGVKDLTDEEFEEVKYRVSVEFMKGRNDKYQELSGPNFDVPMVKGENGGKGMIRAGGANEKKMTEEQKEKLRQIAIKSVGEEMARLAEEGFEV